MFFLLKVYRCNNVNICGFPIYKLNSINLIKNNFVESKRLLFYEFYCLIFFGLKEKCQFFFSGDALTIILLVYNAGCSFKLLQRSILFQQESRFVINYQFSPSSRNLSKTISKKWRFYIEGFVCYINDSSGSSVLLLFFMVALIMPYRLSVILHDTKTCRTKANNNNNRCC